MKTFLVNSKKQDLIEHSFLVAKVAESLFNHFFSKEKYEHFLMVLNEDNNKVLSFDNIVLVLKQSALFHDVGKIEKRFQSYIKSKNKEEDSVDVQVEKVDFENYLLHHEISFALMACLKETMLMKAFNRNAFLYGLLYHHASVLREKEFETVFDMLSSDIDVEELFEDLEEFSLQMHNLLVKKKETCFFSAVTIDQDENEEILERAKNTKIIEFQSSQFLNAKNENTEFFKNALFYLIRSILISADRLVSALNPEKLKTIIENENYDFFISEMEGKDKLIDIQKELEKLNDLFENSERSNVQSKVAKEASESLMPSVLKGSAGVGKTKIMLEYIREINNNKRNFIIVPRKVIAESLFLELSNFYLTNNVSVEIVTSDEKTTSLNKNFFPTESENLFQSDVVITTIDQILNMMKSHKNIDLFLDVLTSNLLFDEFHEFLEQPAILMLFIQVVYLKHLTKNSACLFVSATPNYFLVKEKMKILNKNIFSIKSFNETNYKITLNRFNDEQSAKNIMSEMFNAKEKGDICIFNTATKAQISAIKTIGKEDKTIVYHSKYFKHQKEKLSNIVLSNFNKKEAKKDIVLRSGPILQASLDISCDRMFTEISTIDNIFQRMGRVVRWGEKENGEYHIFIPTDLNKTNSILRNFNNLCVINSTLMFIDFLNKNEEKLDAIKLNQLYDLYDLFFQDREVINAFKKDFEKLKEEASKIFKNGIAPIKFISKKSAKNKQKLSKNLRSNNDIFCVVHNMNINQKNEEEIVDLTNDFQNNMFTMSKDLFYSFEKSSEYAEESRDQIVKYSKQDEALSKVENNIKLYSYNARKKLRSVSSSLILSLAKNEDVPLFLSFKNKTKKINESEQYFNLNFKGVDIGIIKKSNFSS